jgi:hypothetical protein
MLLKGKAIKGLAAITDERYDYILVKEYAEGQGYEFVATNGVIMSVVKIGVCEGKVARNVLIPTTEAKAMKISDVVNLSNYISWEDFPQYFPSSYEDIMKIKNDDVPQGFCYDNSQMLLLAKSIEAVCGKVCVVDITQPGELRPVFVTGAGNGYRYEGAIMPCRRK